LAGCSGGSPAGAAFGGWIWQYLKRGRQPGEDEPAATDASRDGTDGQSAPQRTGKFVVDKDAGGKYHFTLVASNGQVIATSEAYERRQAALNGIEAVKKNAPHAEIASQDGE
jgi:uncharacterized protein YegP (UPF0339 family)